MNPINEQPQENAPLNNKDKIKRYRTDFYRNKYRNDKDYRDKKREYNKQRYDRLTLNCKTCSRRWHRDVLHDPDYNNFICPDCLPENKVEQSKSKRGRPKKIKTDN